jgi:diaminopimelate epimerase
MAVIRFYKMHGLGNDFVLIDQQQQAFLPDANVIQRLSDRNTGIGFDQLLIVDRSLHAIFHCRIFNADGTEAEQCGNGLRCAARYIHDHYLQSETEFLIATKAGQFQITILNDGLIQVALGIPDFLSGAIPVSLPALESLLAKLPPELTYLSCVALGNPHVIFKVPAIDSIHLELVGGLIAKDSAFAKGVNVGFLQVLSSTRAILRTYERGAGLTLACGSNSCAAAVAGIQKGFFKETVELELARGMIKVTWSNQSGPVIMTGPAEYVFEGVLAV